MIKKNFALAVYDDGIETLKVELLNYETEDELVQLANQRHTEANLLTDSNIRVAIKKLPDIYSMKVDYHSIEHGLELPENPSDES